MKGLKFGTTKIELPKDYIIKDEKGDKIIDTLTKKKNLTTKKGIKSVNLTINNNIDKPKIIYDGDLVDYEIKPKIKKTKIKIKDDKNIKKKIIKEENIKLIDDIKKDDIKKMNVIKLKIAEIKILNNNNNDIDKNNITNVFNEIEDYNKIFSTSRKDILIKIVNIKEKMNILNNVQDLGNFYQTPEEYAEYFYEDTKKEQYKNILDIGCGLLGLTKYIIKNTINNNLNFINKILLNEVNDDFIKILKPLDKDKRIDLYGNDILKNYNNYFNKNLQLIISNPPYAAWVDNKENNLGYLFFLYVIYRIAQKNIKYSLKPTIYIIIPKTYYKDNNNGYFDIPKKTKNDIINYFKKTDKKLKIEYDDYNDDLENNWFYGVKLLKDVNGFKKFNNGKISELGMTVGLFEITL